MTIKKIYLGSDHAGFRLKEKIKQWLEQKRIPFVDVGAHKLVPTDDYPDYAVKVARNVVKSKCLGILMCGSAQGMGIAANKVKGIRAVIPSSVKEAQLAREHNNANVICLSGWFMSFNKVTKIVDSFLRTKFSNESRHRRRIHKIMMLEKRL